MRYINQHAIITGGSSGIGKATALLLAAQGAHISIIARNPERLASAQAEIMQARAVPEQRVAAISADVSVRAEAERAVESAVAEIGAPHIVITSAGMVQPGLFRELPIESFEQTIALNYLGTVYIIKAALPHMLTQGYGNIVMVSSGAGLAGVYGYTSYSPSKFALHGLAQSLRAELKPEGICVSVVFPPDTDTPQLAEENLHKSEEARRINGSARTLSAEEVAQEIERGMCTGAPSIAPGLEMKVLARLSSVIAPALNWYQDRVIADVRREQRNKEIRE